MRQTILWWVCTNRDEAMSKVGNEFAKKHSEHVKKCPDAGYCIRQIEQRKGKKK